MARTPSTMLKLGTTTPFFALQDAVTGETITLLDYSSADAFLVVFWCNHCPFVKHIEDGFVAFAREYLPRGLEIVAINSNDVDAYPQDSPEAMKELANEKDYPFPYLFDDTQEVAKTFEAACTPDFFLFDGKQRLVYRGQFDDSRPSLEVPVTGADLRAAADQVLSGQTPGEDQKPSLGCNIKWVPGNEPDYYGA